MAKAKPSIKRVGGDYDCKHIKRMEEVYSDMVCEPIADYCRATARIMTQRDLFPSPKVSVAKSDIRVVELFAGVGGFRVGLERASKRYKTVWNNQWEPSTKRQDASIVYCRRFGSAGHSNVDIATVPVSDIPAADLLVGGFPCQDYSVATTLKNAAGIEGKKGVLWWQIYRILHDSKQPPRYLFLENVDRLLKSPATQRGRDFAIILASLADLGYIVEWRVINAADYGMPQRRRRTYIVACRKQSPMGCLYEESQEEPFHLLLRKSVIARAFGCKEKDAYSASGRKEFDLEGSLADISATFNTDKKGKGQSPFHNAGIMMGRRVHTMEVEADYDGPTLTLGQLLVDERDVPNSFFISEQDLPQWEYQKGSKTEKRINSAGYEYNYSEGKMAFPDALDKPSRTVITGEGGSGASRFKHVVLTPSGRYRRLMPIELERLNMFPDNHTEGATDTRRAFLMGNALVTGVVERIGRELLNYM